MAASAPIDRHLQEADTRRQNAQTTFAPIATKIDWKTNDLTDAKDIVCRWFGDTTPSHIHLEVAARIAIRHL